MILQAATPEEVSDIVRAHVRLRPVAGRSKPALSAPDSETASVDVSALTGLLEYQPQESTFSARAATPVSEIDALLAQHGQYLPFDPPFGAHGATLGGTVASGLSGPLRYRYGGVRDFLLGARFVDGEGQVVRSGGKVVKNAAGFYLHHLLIGSLGRLGILVDLAFKVFPKPEGYTTVVASYSTLANALTALDRLRRSPFEPAAVELVPLDGGRSALYVRLGGAAAALPTRAEQLARHLEGPTERLEGANDDDFWRDARDLSWAPAGAALVKVPVTPGRIASLDATLATHDAVRRYGAGGEVAWVAWPGALAALHALLEASRLSGLLVADRGETTAPHGDALLGARPGGAFLARARQALDPNGRFAAGA
ncbi:MAG: FAD-binding protein [Vicinamibacteraceae bacterium]